MDQNELIGKGKFYEVNDEGRVEFIDSEVEPVKIVGEISEVRVTHTARYGKPSRWRRLIGKLKRFCKKEES